MARRKGKQRRGHRSRRGRGGQARAAARASQRRRVLWWVLRGVLVYLMFNLGVNLALAVTRNLDLTHLLEFGHLDSRSRAVLMLARHRVWHSSWEDEQVVGSLIHQAAVAEGLDPELFNALIVVESARRPHVISPVGACGLGQLMPRTARELGVVDPFDPRENLQGAAAYLSRMLKRFRGDTGLALAAYNAGPGAVARAGRIPRIPETQRYVQKILARHARSKGVGGAGENRVASPKGGQEKEGSPQ